MLPSDVTVLYLHILHEAVARLVSLLLLRSGMEQCNSLTSRYTAFLSDTLRSSLICDLDCQPPISSTTAWRAGVGKSFTEGASRKLFTSLSTFIVLGIFSAVFIMSYYMNA